MASSNQLINGNLALLVNIIKKNTRPATNGPLIAQQLKHIKINKQTSPNRDETKVIIEERKLR